METKSSGKKAWKTPDVMLISSADIRAKHIAGSHPEGFFTKTVPYGPGSYKFYHNNMSYGWGPNKLSSYNS